MAEQLGQSGPQRLRWWQEDKARVTPARIGVLTTQTTAVESTSNIGQELEEEAARRVSEHRPSELIDFYADRKLGKGWSRLQMFKAFVWFTLIGLRAVEHHNVAMYAVWGLFTMGFAWAFTAEVRLRNAKTPILTVSLDGISVSTYRHHVSLIRWSEIEQILAYGCRSRRVFGIITNDSADLTLRVPKIERLSLRRTAALNRRVYRRRGTPLPAVNVSESYLSVSPDDLVAQIATFRREHRL